MFIETINPATEEILHQYELLTNADMENKIQKGQRIFLKWKTTSFNERSLLMINLAELLCKKKIELSELIAMEMGKPVTQGQAEIEKCAWVCEHYAANAEHYLQNHSINTEMSKTFVTYQPLGIVFAIMPWNFPFWQVFRFAAPTLMAGNVAILRHAPISTGVGNAIEQLFLEAGFPAHLFQHFIIDNDQAAQVIAHEKIVALSFTGSDKTGRIVGGLAASHLKKAVLELGGSDPYVILADADIELAAQAIVSSRLNNCGQVCIAAKRVIVDHSIHDQLIEKIKSQMETYIMGNPMLSTVKLGPMARKDLRENLHNQVTVSVDKGAQLLEGGTIPSGEGYYYPPTLLSNVKTGMPAFEEELFGPVIVIIKAKDEKEAISLANKTVYGLGAAVFTRDLERGEHIAAYEIEAGVCFVNSFVASDPRVPFGGVKQSGFGRELSREGILEFVNTKTIAIK